MSDKYNTVIVLSNVINKDGSLQEDVRLRVEKSVELYNEELGEYVTMSGKIDWTEKFEDFPYTQAEAMKRYAVVMGLPEKDILKEETSKDSVGQAYFVKRDIVVPKNWEKLIVVSSDYHMERIRTVFDHIFGKDFYIRYEEVDTPLKDDTESVSHEQRSLKIFQDQFGDITPGDDEAITERLFSEHAVYNKDPDSYSTSK